MSEEFPYSLGKYRIEAEVGRGGFGNVYRAVDTALERPIALKVLDPVYMRDRTWINRFRREAIVMARLDHPHIVPIYDTGEIDGRLFLAMKLVEGNNLAQVIQERGAFTWKEVLAMIRQIASALDYAHGMNVLHRDLKPANVLLEDERVLLTDFGLARLVESNSVTLSTHGGITGTYQYMAPELFNDEEAERATDIYALGCILYELVTGSALFDAGTTAAIISAHLRPLELPETFPNDIPNTLTDVLHLALAKEPAARYQSGTELMAALDNIDADQLAEPYAALEQAILGQDWATALSLAESIRAVNANYRDVQTHYVRALQGEETGKRQRWAEQWRSEAEEALAQDEVMTAEVALRQWRKVDPENPKVQVFGGQLERLRRYQELENAVNEERWVEAKTLADEVRAKDPSFRDTPALLARIDARFAPPQVRTPSPAPDARSVQPQETAQPSLKTPERGRRRWIAISVLGIVVVSALALGAWGIGALQGAPAAETAQVTRSADADESNGIEVIPEIDDAANEGVGIAEKAAPAEGSAVGVTRVVEEEAAEEDAEATPVVEEASVEADAGADETPVVEEAAVELPADPPANARLGDTWTRPADGMVMVYVPAGTFLMGSDEGRHNERPAHEVTLGAFWIDMTEVTVEMFAQFVDRTGYVTDAENGEWGKVCRETDCLETEGADWQSPFGPDSDFNAPDSHPVTQVSWNDADAYCSWIGGRLPTEAQWEYAARGPDNLMYPWGNRLEGSLHNSCDENCEFEWADDTVDDGFAITAPVGSYPGGASWTGALDMSGNVWEWVQDWYDGEYYANSPRVNPLGPASGESRLLRGGSWTDFSENVRSSYRFPNVPWDRVFNLGFRCTLDR